MVVAYAMLLQSFLIGVATTAAAAENSGSLGGVYIICSSNGNQFPAPSDDSGRAPARDGACLLCLMAGSGPAALPPTTASLLVVAAAEVVGFTPFLDRCVICERHTPRQSQGPPRTA